jgi:hypothetical protein
MRIAAAFLALWCLPRFQHTHVLPHDGPARLRQVFIGQLEAFRAGGGGRRVSLRTLFSRTSIGFRACSRSSSRRPCCHTSLAQPHVHAGTIAPVLNVFVGANQIGALTIFSIAARACPPRREVHLRGTDVALQRRGQFSSVIGGRLYHNTCSTAPSRRCYGLRPDPGAVPVSCSAAAQVGSSASLADHDSSAEGADG